MTSRPSTAAPIVIVLAIGVAIVSATVGIYVGGYFWLGERIDWAVEDDQTASRFYPEQWMVTVFEPGARIETWFTGVKVSAEEYRETCTMSKD